MPVKVISERLGHESPAFTLKQYAHVMPGMQAEAAQRIATFVTESPSEPLLTQLSAGSVRTDGLLGEPPGRLGD